MITKLLEVFFRHKLLLLLPPLLIPAIVSPIALLALPPLYDTSVGVWVDHPTYLNYKDDSNPFVSPALNESGRLNELLHTRAFIMDVAGRTSLAPLVGSTAGEARIGDLISRGVTIGGTSPTGAAPANAAEHLLVVHVQAGTAQLSYELCKAIVDAYQEKTTADQADQATVAVDFYQARVQDAQQQLTQASQGLRRYVASHQPDGDTTQAGDPTQPGLQATLLDPKLGTLETSVQTAQLDFNNATAALTQAQHDAQAAAQGQQYGFQVLDPAQMPTVATPQTKKIIIYPIAALIAGLGLSAMLLVLLVASDRSVRSEADLAPGLRVLGVVPTLELKRVPKQLRGVATRRAMGAVAGTALPSPTGVK